MATLATTHGCAEDQDGCLLDATEIVWYNDADDDIPIAPSSSGATKGSSCQPSAATATTLDKYFASSPTKKIAGSRRSTHVMRPSTKATDPNNVMTHKRKISHSEQPERRSR